MSKQEVNVNVHCGGAREFSCQCKSAGSFEKKIQCRQCLRIIRPTINTSSSTLHNFFFAIRVAGVSTSKSYLCATGKWWRTFQQWQRAVALVHYTHPLTQSINQPTYNSSCRAGCEQRVFTVVKEWSKNGIPSNFPVCGKSLIYSPEESHCFCSSPWEFYTFNIIIKRVWLVGGWMDQ